MCSNNETIPEGMVLRDDGCLCPDPNKKAKSSCSKLATCPYDPRFPNTNQTKHCFVSFLDYQKCARLLGDYPGCEIFYHCYTALCPRSWWEKWYTQMEDGTFPRKIYPPSPIIYPDPQKIGRYCPGEDEEEPDIC